MEEMATHSRILVWEIHDRGPRAGYSPWCCKESDMTGHWTATTNPILQEKGLEACAKRQILSKSESNLSLTDFEIHPIY